MSKAAAVPTERAACRGGGGSVPDVCEDRGDSHRLGAEMPQVEYLPFAPVLVPDGSPSDPEALIRQVAVV